MKRSMHPSRMPVDRLSSGAGVHPSGVHPSWGCILPVGVHTSGGGVHFWQGRCIPLQPNSYVSKPYLNFRLKSISDFWAIIHYWLFQNKFYLSKDETASFFLGKGNNHRNQNFGKGTHLDAWRLFLDLFQGWRRVVMRIFQTKCPKHNFRTQSDFDISVKYPFLSIKVCQSYCSEFPASLCICTCRADIHVQMFKVLFAVNFLKRIET